MTELRSTIISLFMAGNSNGEIFRILKTQMLGGGLSIALFRGSKIQGLYKTDPELDVHVSFGPEI